MTTKVETHHDLIQTDLECEQKWLLDCVLPETLGTVQTGITECLQAIQNEHNTQSCPITLPLSSTQSELLKGVITRQSDSLTRADYTLRFNARRKSNPFRANLRKTCPIALDQIIEARNFLQEALRVLDRPLTRDNAAPVLEDAYEYIRLSRCALRQPAPANGFPYKVIPNNYYEDELPAAIVTTVSIQEASIVFECRLLHSNEPHSLIHDSAAFPSLSRFFAAPDLKNPLSLIGTGSKTNDIKNLERARYLGEDVYILECIKVEAQDPLLLACLAKLSGTPTTESVTDLAAIETTMLRTKRKVDIVFHSF